ncbi:lipid hydroperoxide peroxidase [Listeria newyorkensis]|uniref:Thiol peroxidase n=1 Tax=Listeria newyorkensis TaxID=1497681 RepID=A0ABX4XL50_9LIST|nr:thiol peroxidase [Listeria newyorkensis]KGL39270.1 peroxidase [Listeria newyorkensis]PNP91950.1 lipid hydroperoxide peroxidase [Listeria newyorkensis]WAO22218.1 thiol peroxidase [Listeria newyorkensis]SQC52145.1 Probable thiol peroxidase [Listeria newyorkensis]
MTKITFMGTPMTLIGKEVKVGDKAPDFTVLNQGLEPVTLSDYDGKVKIISVIPSIDTGVCSQQTRKFNEEASSLENTVILTISVDLPFAQKKWCDTEGLPNVTTLSDHRDLSFGEAYGVVIEELRLLTRAVFVLNSDNRVVHAEYVGEVTDHPDYETAITKAKETE